MSVWLNSHPTHAAYLHIPFCRRRCYYCDFPISVVGEKAIGNTSSSIEEYVEFLCQEITAAPKPAAPLETIFFGGGTPSLLSVQQLEKILLTLKQQFGIAAGAEISLEMDPGTFNLDQVKGYARVGVNRVSLGAQAFQNELLKLCGRFHLREDIFNAVDLVRQAGITNLSLDLISGLPQQTLYHWRDSLTTAISLAPEHLSCYDLVLEPVTAFGKQYQPGEKPLPSDEMTAQMYRVAQSVLTSAGYEHYEISNYAQQGYSCRHNRVYWENRPYYGFGMGAASYMQQQRFTRPRTRREYYAWVETFVGTGGVITAPTTSQEDVLLETLMLGLRLAQGVSLEYISQQFGTPVLTKIGKCLQPYYERGWVEVISPEHGIKDLETLPHIQSFTQARLKLSDPEGFLFSNTILADLFAQLTTP